MTRLRKLLTLGLVAALLAGVTLTAVPVTASAASPAAPVAQIDDVSGTYVSDVYPAASAPGLVLLMSLYPNNNAEVVSYYFSNPPVIEQGTWESSGDSVTVSLTGNTQQTYDQPSVETFTVGDGSLTSGNFVFHKLGAITPEQMDAATDAAAAEATAEATEEATAEATEEATAEATEEPAATAEATEEAAEEATEEATEEAAATAEATEEPAEEPAATPEPSEEAAAGNTAAAASMEIFVTDVYPAADASGMVMLLALFPNGNMEQLSVYLGKDAILEVGTWTEDAGAIETTLTGQLDQEYETPVTASYTRDGDGLTDGTFRFQPLRVITPADIEAMLSPAGTYVSKLYPAADAPGMMVVLSLFANNNVEQVTIYIGTEAVMEQGTWAENDDGSLTVTITGSGDQTYDTPSETQYTRSGETLTGGGFELTRVVEVTPAEMDAATEGATEGSDSTAAPTGEATAEPAEEATAEATAEPTEEPTEEATAEATAEPTEEATAEPTKEPTEEAAGDAPMAVYQSDTLPAADSPGRVITLSLYEEGNRAEMSLDFLNDMPPYVDIGTWESTAEGQLTVTLTHSADQGEYATPIVIGFDDVDGTLTAVDYDETLFGSEGLTLHAVQ